MSQGAGPWPPALDQADSNGCPSNSQIFSPGQCRERLSRLSGWQLIEADGVAQLSKSYPFADFSQALAFTNRIGRLSEAQNHHPALLTEWGKVTVKWWSHCAKGLQQIDFTMAARTDELLTRGTD